MSDKVVVSGKVSFTPGAAPFNKATAYISLLDVSRQDAPSKTIAKQIIKNVKFSAGKEIKFSLNGEIDDPRGMYIVSAHIDVDGDGKLSIGDYITTGYYAVATDRNTTDLQVLVHPVRS